MIEALFVVALLGAVLPAQVVVPGRQTSGRAFAVAAVSAVLLGLGVLMHPGSLAGDLALPWLAVAAWAALARLPGIWRRRRSITCLAEGLAADIACAYLAVGATWAAFACFGLRPMGFEHRIVLLTAVHFHVAGFVLVLAGELLRRRSRTPVIAAGLAVLVVGIPTTALGFLGVAGAALIGAWLVASGGIVVGAGHLLAGVRGSLVGVPRPLPVVAGASLLVSMPIAIVWATSVWLGVGFLSIPVMAALHGGLNVLGFAVPAVFAWRAAAPA